MEPMDLSQRRDALRCLSYGLYAIGARHEGPDGPSQNAFLANWLSQVSFDPPLVALSVDRGAWSWPLIEASGVFSVNVLATGQRALAGALGRSRHKVGDKLRDLPWRPGPATACPVLHEHALAFLECRLRAVHPAGDSQLLVAEVVHAERLRPGAPLTMAETGFHHAG